MANDQDIQVEDCPFTGHAIIAGYGVPGRAVGDLLSAHHLAFCVIELNPRTVDRCPENGVHMIAGDVREEATLLRAGIERAVLFAIAIPNDAAVLETIRIARRLIRTCISWLDATSSPPA